MNLSFTKKIQGFMINIFITKAQEMCKFTTQLAWILETLQNTINMDYKYANNTNQMYRKSQKLNIFRDPCWPYWCPILTNSMVHMGEPIAVRDFCCGVRV